jgi:mono/diheme cytochrome c family protein
MAPIHAGTLVSAFILLVANSAVAADAANGVHLAERWCSACHVVTSDQRQANADAPPFEEIAKAGFHRVGPDYVSAGPTRQDAEYESDTNRSGGHCLLDPHAKMPNMNLTRIEAGDIAAYMAKLR